MKKQSNKKQFQAKENLTNSLKLPKDIMFGASVVTLTGNQDVWIENYKGIVEYTENSILIQCKTCQIAFEGTNLSIDYYTNEDMKITGYISSIRYL